MMGVHIHIDDFGTGYSSLSYLHRFPVNALRIDRSFIAKLSAAHENEEMVRTIIALARHLNLDVIAEGIEQDDQLSAIKDLACGFGQGFLFSRPLPVDAMEAWSAALADAANGVYTTIVIREGMCIQKQKRSSQRVYVEP